MREYDAIVIGAGPAGLTSGIYCSRANLKTLVLGDIYGSQVAKTDVVENYPGFPEPVRGMELVELMFKQAQRYGAENNPTLVYSVEPVEGGFVAHTEEGDYRGRALIIATGAHPKKIGISGEEKLENRGLSYCYVCDGALYRDATVAMVGLGNGLARGALYLAGIAKKVYALNVQPELMCEAVYVDRLREIDNVELVDGVRLLEVLGDEVVTGVRFEHESVERTVEVEGVFIEYGWAPNVDLARQLGLELVKNRYIRVDRETMSTSVSGVFAAGDVTGGRRQIATAVGGGAAAAISAIGYIKRGLTL